MNAQTVSILRSDSRQWWYHSELRKNNLHSQARKLETKTVRNLIKKLREAYLITKGQNGVSMHLETSYITGHNSKLIDIALVWAPWIPFVDKTTINEDILFKYVLRTPQPTKNGNDTYLNVGQYIAVWEKLGALVHWGNIQNPDLYRKDPRVLAELERITA